MTAVATTIPEQLTEEQLLSLPHIGKAEMIDGRLIVAPAGFEHGGISSRLLARLYQFVESNRLGMVFDSSTGFWMRQGNLLSPDVGFVAAKRLKGMKTLPRRYFRGSPDLVVEVLSPNDRKADMDKKLADYFQSDTQLAWVVDPVQKSVAVYRDAKDPARVLGADELLDGEEVVPGFTLALSDLFAAPDFG